jgi:hypothetical protein
LKREGLRKILRSASEKAKLKKRVYPYLFRHTRATLNATFMTEAEMCIYFGWEQGSKMPRIYVHLSGREVDDKLLRFYNLKKERERVCLPTMAMFLLTLGFSRIRLTSCRVSSSICIFSFLLRRILALPGS